MLWPTNKTDWLGNLVHIRAISTRTDRASAVTIVDASRKHSRASRRYSPARFPISSPRKYAALKEARTLASQKVPKIFWNQFHWCEFPQIRIEEGIMWLTLASIALASAVTLNILGIFWLSAHRVVKEPESWNMNADPWAPGERLSTFSH
jgi:hypothetical protein